ncbi:glycosyltransferase [Gemmatimonas sp.]|uniref:glycosyltransferase n=1 Tax=Gemmatimonas sp. TaxID=1962908 RepID=UPI0039835989
MTILAVIAFAALAAILFIWLGYPVVIWLIAKVAGQPNEPNLAAAATRRVSVVLATRDSVEPIQARVANLLDSAHPAELIEVIVALDVEGSKATPEQLRELDACVRVVVGDSPGGKASTLNAGVRAATGDILVMADAAQRFDAHTIPQLVAALEDSRFGAVSGALDLGCDGGTSPVDLYWRMEKWLRYNESLIHSSVGVTGAVYATRKALWVELPAGTLLDDVYVPMSLVLRGHRVAFSYAAKARDVRTFDSKAEGARKTRTLTGVMQLLSLLPAIRSSANPIRAQFVMHKLARLTTPLWLVIVAIAALGMSVLVTAQYPTGSAICLGALLTMLAVIPALRRRAAKLVGWGFALQVATAKAVINGLRGSWSVWQNSDRK